MSEDDAARAAVARLTVDLVAAYCGSLPIEPHELPELIRYVGSVLSQSAGAIDTRPAAVPLSWSDPRPWLAQGVLFPARRDAILARPESPAEIVCLAAYRARSAARGLSGA